MFPASVYSNATEGAAHCRYYCIGSLACSYWTYSTSIGCWAEDVAIYRMPYPFVFDKKQMLMDSEAAKTTVAGEYIQHYCGGDASIQPGITPVLPTAPPRSKAMEEVKEAKSCAELTSELLCYRSARNENSKLKDCAWDAETARCNEPQQAAWWSSPAVMAIGPAILGIGAVATGVYLCRGKSRKQPSATRGMKTSGVGTQLEDVTPLMSRDLEEVPAPSLSAAAPQTMPAMPVPAMQGGFTPLPQYQPQPQYYAQPSYSTGSFTPSYTPGQPMQGYTAY